MSGRVRLSGFLVLLAACTGGGVSSHLPTDNAPLDVRELPDQGEEVLRDLPGDLPDEGGGRDLPSRDEGADGVMPDGAEDAPDAPPTDPGMDLPGDTPPRDLPPEGGTDLPGDPGRDVPPRDSQEDQGATDLPGEVAVPCTEDRDCEEALGPEPCERARCVDRRCVLEPRAEQDPCDDGTLCTENDRCIQGVCTGTPILCADNDPCTVDACLPLSGCVFQPFEGPCDDGDRCTQNDRCLEGQCRGEPVVCDDDNPCTENSCQPLSGCVFLPLTGTLCDDRDPCSQDDRCQNGRCVGVGGCNDGDPCTLDTCDEGLVCRHDPLTGTPCDDGDPCSADDHCQEGACTGTHSCDDGNPCTDDECTATGCVHRNHTRPCDDGDPCTAMDACREGRCVGTPYSCTPAECEATATCDGQGGCVATPKETGTPCSPDDSDCTWDVCREGHCVHPPKDTGTPCDDGDRCTRTDRCEDGVCVGTDLVVCPETDPCKSGSCDPRTGTCTAQAKPDGELCNDYNRCTQNDICRMGVCRGENPVVCRALDQCHTVGVCNPSTGLCTQPLKPDGSPCYDGNLCTRTDSCQGGVCTGSDPVVCEAGDQCHEDGVCDPTTGSCRRANRPNGTPCQDGNLCTRNDQCVNGVCKGTQYSCSDGIFCTQDFCDGTGGCSYLVQSGYCLINGTCRTGTWVDPTNPCRRCDPERNPQGFSPREGPCDDGNLCTIGDTCQGLSCVGTPYSCDDGLQCTSDLCDGIGGCTNPLATGWCLIDGTCQRQGVANPANACERCWPTTSPNQWSPKPENADCDDGDLCTTGDVCVQGVCGGTPYTCDDGLACTEGLCNGSGGCNFIPREGWCLINGACHLSGDLNPLNDCEACDPMLDAGDWSPAREGLACDDGDPCTQNDHCASGSCRPGPSLCDDGLACTADVCLPGGGCDHPLLAGWCLIGGQCYPSGARAPGAPCSKCDPATATDAWTSAEGEACTDGDPCTLDDVCVDSVCTGVPLDCNDGIDCTADRCENATCLHEVLEGWCNIYGTGCVEAGTLNPDNPCERCDPVLSFGIWQPVTDGLPCDDGNPCTLTSSCSQGACSGAAYSCDDGLLCTTERCDGQGGCIREVNPGWCAIGGVQCAEAGQLRLDNPCMGCDPLQDPWNWSYRNGASCDDGESCTRADTCLIGTCQGIPYVCDDGLDCTIDQCTGDGNCAARLAANTCLIDGLCWPDLAPSPTNVCLGCVPSIDPWHWSPRDGQPCDDGEACTIHDFCGNGQCAGSPYSCDDGQDCTLDVCDGQGGCLHPIASGWCQIQGTCYSDGQVDPVSPCRVCDASQNPTEWAARNGIPCNDGNSCTIDDTCSNRRCVGTSYSCNDSNPCTYDLCDGSGGCANPLREDVCVIAGQCVSAGYPNPAQPCEACSPGVNQFGWTVLDPGTPEICNNGVDDNCDGVTDPEGAPGCTIYYLDNDGDGYGIAAENRCLCSPDAPWSAPLAGDCDDDDLTVHPGVPEVCNGKDEDCDGFTDPENSPGCLFFYRDADGDGYGVIGDGKCLCAATGVYRAFQQGDCDEGDPTVHYEAVEVCDGKDNDCNGVTDPAGSTGCRDYYVDRDGDGYGDSSNTQCLCGPKAPYVTTRSGDCNDQAATVNPGRTEVCNQVDDDCSGTPDDAPLNVLCPTDAGPLHGTVACTTTCVLTCDGPAGGQPGWHDLDRNLRNGCECQGDSWETQGGAACDQAVNLGDLPDDGSSQTITGNLSEPDATDWFLVNAQDTTWNAETNSCDLFNLRVAFLSNPNGAFAVTVRRGSCQTSAELCDPSSLFEWSTRLYTPDAGECPCSPTVTPYCDPPAPSYAVCMAKEKNIYKCGTCPGYGVQDKNLCEDSTSTFYIQVRRLPNKPVTCDGYRIEISNGKYSFSGG